MILHKIREYLRLRLRANKYRGKIDPDDIEFMISSLEPGNTAIDIGCHKGGYLYWMQKSVSPGGRVIAFEPQEALNRYLQKMVDLFGWKHVEIIPMAVSNYSGQVNLYAPKDRNTTGATLEAGIFAENDAAFPVESTKLDDFLQKEPYRGLKINLLKVDVESHELAVFEGAKETLLRDHPIVMFECEQRVYLNRSITEVFDFLTNLGYQGFFYYEHQLLRIEEFDLKKHQDTATPGYPNAPGYANNFIFIPAQGER